jgi:two-component system, sensor histidine kinase and response regulator
MLFGYFMMTSMRYEVELREKDEVIRARNDELRALNDTNLMMMSVIAHDLRNPVGSASRYVRKHLSPAEIDLNAKRDSIRVLAKTLADTDDLLENLLLWARERASPAATIDRAPMSLDSSIRPALDAVAQAATEKGLALAYGDAGLRVLAERNGPAVVFRNLLSNAVKFTPSGGRVEIEARAFDGRVEVAVSDTGKGMDAESVARLNGGGELQSTPGTAGEKGNGMGLSLCRRFMLSQGCGFRVESALGEGSRFVLTFPGCDER